MDDFKKNTITPEEFKSWCSSNGLSVENAGTVLGVYRATAYKYANGTLPVGKTILIAMGLYDLIEPEKRKGIFETLIKAYAEQKKSK